MEDLPPKTLKTQLVHLDHNLKQIERSQFAGIQRAPGSLPVLEAFQEFLDKERQKAKKRLMAVTALFAVMIILAVAAGVAIVALQAKRTAADYSSLIAKTGKIETQIKKAGATSQLLIDDLESRLSSNSENQQQLFAAHSNVVSIVDRESNQIAEMQKIIEKLESENSDLKTNLGNIIEDWQSVTQRIEKIYFVQENLVRQKEEEKGKPYACPKTIRRAAVRPVTPTPPPKSSSIMMTITPKGDSQGIRWRLPHINQE
jgi:hypothetical protein